jgi:hypothetical protein
MVVDRPLQSSACRVVERLVARTADIVRDADLELRPAPRRVAASVATPRSDDGSERDEDRNLPPARPHISPPSSTESRLQRHCWHAMAPRRG